MPVKRGTDANGPYFKWGDSGKHYYYRKGDKDSREKARAKAEKQGRAAYANGYKGGGKK